MSRADLQPGAPWRIIAFPPGARVMSEPARRFRFDYLTAAVPRSIVRSRQNLRLLGWARTKLIVVHRTPSPTAPGYEIVTIVLEGRGQIGGTADERFLSATEWKRLRQQFKPGVRVRTRSVGYNFAAGIRHIMPSGSIGLVARHQGVLVRVRFPDLSGRTFAYGTGALELEVDPA